MNSSAKKSLSVLASGAIIIFAGTLVSRFLGLIKENLISNFVHPESIWILDAYNSAFILPDFLYNLLAGGALAAAFIPVFSTLLKDGKTEEANRTASGIINILISAIVVGLVFIFIFAPQLVHLIAPNYQVGTGKYNLTVILTREMCVMVIFTALSGLFTGILQSHKNFLVPVIIWNIYNIFSIMGVALFSKIPNYSFLPSFLHIQGETIGIHGLALGVVVGAISMAVIQFPAMLKKGFKYYPVFAFKSPAVRQIGILFVPAMLGLALSQFNMLQLPTIMASYADGDGGVFVLSRANRLVLLPMGLFAISIATAAFPILSQLSLQTAKKEYIATFNSSLRSILMLIIPSAFALIALAYPCMILLYAGKNSGLTNLNAMGLALTCLALSLIGIGAIQIINRGFYALKDTLTPVIVNITMVVINFIGAYTLINVIKLSVCGIGISTSITSVIAAVILFCLLARKVGGVDGMMTAKITGKMIISSIVMVGIILVTAHLMAPTIEFATVTKEKQESRIIIDEQHNTIKISPFSQEWRNMPDFENPNTAIPITPGYRLAVFVQIAVSGILGFIAYFVMLVLLKVPGAHMYVNKLLTKLHLKKAKPANENVL